MEEFGVSDIANNDADLTQLLEKETIFGPAEDRIVSNDFIDINAPIILTSPNREPIILPPIANTNHESFTQHGLFNASSIPPNVECLPTYSPMPPSTITPMQSVVPPSPLMAINYGYSANSKKLADEKSIKSIMSEN